MIPAVNQWTSVVPPMPRSIVRNIPLMIQGLGFVVLLFRDSARAGDRTFRLIARMIVVSYACYVPVILFAPTHPLLGMLMIPKTCACLAVAFIANKTMFRGKVRKKKTKWALPSPIAGSCAPQPHGWGVCYSGQFDVCGDCAFCKMCRPDPVREDRCL